MASVPQIPVWRLFLYMAKKRLFSVLALQVKFSTVRSLFSLELMHTLEVLVFSSQRLTFKCGPVELTVLSYSRSQTLAKQRIVKTNRCLCFCPFLFTALFPEDLRWSLVFIQVQDDRDTLSSDSESRNWKDIVLQSNSPPSCCRKREWGKRLA